MKAIAYYLSPQQKELLIIANQKKHDITIIGNQLTEETIGFAAGKEALLILTEMVLSPKLMEGLQQLGIKYIATLPLSTIHIDLIAARSANLMVFECPLATTGELTEYKGLINKLDNWAVLVK